MIMTSKDCVPEFVENIAGKWVWLDSTGLKEQYRDGKWQLFFATSGFGCDAKCSGTAVFGYFAGDMEYCREDRSNVLGVATPESIEAWKRTYPESAGNIELIENENK